MLTKQDQALLHQLLDIAENLSTNKADRIRSAKTLAHTSDIPGLAEIFVAAASQPEHLAQDLKRAEILIRRYRASEEPS